MNTSDTDFTMERLAWVTAYLAHFAGETPVAVLAALGIRESELSRAQRAHLSTMTRATRDGNMEPSTRFASELSLARTKLREQNPSLDDVRATYARDVGTLPSAAQAADPDETVMMRAHLPNMVLPFQRGETAPVQPPAQAPPIEPAPGAGETVLAPILDLSKVLALPFQSKPAEASFDPDGTMMAPKPKKP
jgi:hypothetical protein